MQFPTLPSWIRNAQPGVINDDSPFPPLKPKKRTSTGKRDSAISSLLREETFSYPENGYPNHKNAQVSVYSGQAPPPSSSTTFHLSQQLSQPQFQSFQSFQPFQPNRGSDERLQNILGSDLNVLSHKNKKELTLDILHSNFSPRPDVAVHQDFLPIERHGKRTGSLGSERSPGACGDHSQYSSLDSVSTSKSIPTYELMAPTAPYPTRDFGQIFTPSTERKLSTMLADLKQDVENHRVRDSRAPTAIYVVSSPSDCRQALGKNTCNVPGGMQGESTVPLGEEPLGSPRDDLSLRDNLRDSDETANTSVDYVGGQLYVVNKEEHADVDQRLSTISSILSKNHPEHAEDDEIEKELERQLESLKNCSKVSLDSNLRHNDSYSSALETQAGSGAIHAMLATDLNCVESQNELVSHSQPIQEVVTPFFGKRENERFDQLDPITPLQTQLQEDEDGIHETPDTIKPLSPKTHHLALELKDLQLCQEQEVNPPRSLSNQDDTKSEEILGSSVPEEFEAFPRSALYPAFPLFRTSGVDKALPGTGLCRSCHTEFRTDAKGADRPIFSKSGELSGQWHRGCFQCSYNSCNIFFDKSTTPYVLLDNPFCHHHYHSLNGTLCSLCNMGIEGECIENELRRKWHTNCLTCSRCRNCIQDDYYCVKNEIFCEKDATLLIEERKNLGLHTSDKVEKRRTRLMYLGLGPNF
ncbi:hypothetical protein METBISCDRAFT_24139 [Metschnikowia bicuspidata]|uniref:LIM zinc-binding domain-containing protein n=1 Tax=Metschnikowia bicuspidata TaxID=27322 RepID=A0A4V1J2S0_9ASCO|nr:hypothetical protein METBISCDRAFT_24139 [Metschnikowia bicuspidata]